MNFAATSFSSCPMYHVLLVCMLHVLFSFICTSAITRHDHWPWQLQDSLGHQQMTLSIFALTLYGQYDFHIRHLDLHVALWLPRWMNFVLLIAKLLTWQTFMPLLLRIFLKPCFQLLFEWLSLKTLACKSLVKIWTLCLGMLFNRAWIWS